jgi:hypothetical protein
VTVRTERFTHKASQAIAALAVATVSVLALTSCDYYSSVERIGVTKGDDGSVQIVYLACDYEQPTAVAIWDDKDPTTVDDDELVWEIRSENSADGGVFTVGSQPEGWVETIAFAGEFGNNLIAHVDSVAAEISFAPTDLEPGQVWANGNPSANMDPDAFEQRARESCQYP